jgi:hypothetical protein
MLEDKKFIDTRKRRMDGIRERDTKAATSLVLIFEPITPWRLSKTSLTTLRMMRKIRRMIRMMLMLIRPKIRILLVSGRRYSF